ncbi:MAG TPA: transposase, partial [Ktedonobacteraceae bacterium]
MAVPRAIAARIPALFAALTFEGMGESMIIEGAANAVAFECSIEEIVAPSLTAGQIVIMDNLAAHKGKKVEQLIQSKGCQLLFLPAYSPDFSPIEETFSKRKHVSASSRSSDTRSAPGSHLPSITHGKCTGCA